jgi:hypothetical protein
MKNLNLSYYGYVFFFKIIIFKHQKLLVIHYNFVNLKKKLYYCKYNIN